MSAETTERNKKKDFLKYVWEKTHNIDVGRDDVAKISFSFSHVYKIVRCFEFSVLILAK